MRSARFAMWLPVQELLLEGGGITVEDLRRVSKWHGRVVNPKLASTTASVLVAAMQARRREAGKRVQAAKVLIPNVSVNWRRFLWHNQNN